jgi:hypothetical protein
VEGVAFSTKHDDEMNGSEVRRDGKVVHIFSYNQNAIAAFVRTNLVSPLFLS